MKKTLLFLLVISILSYNGPAQTKYDKHDSLIYEADSLRKNGNCEKAIQKYQNALGILIPNSSTPFFNLAECAINNNNYTLANEWIRKGVSVGGAPISYLKGYDGFSKIKDEEFYKNIIADYNQLRQEYFTSIDNIDLYLEIEELTARDQFVRKIDDYISGRSEKDIENAMNGLLEARKNKDSVAEQKYRDLLFPKPNKDYQKLQNELIRKVDSLNIARLKEITKEHGWQERAWIILWHQRGSYGKQDDVWSYFKPLIDKEIEEGTLSRNFWSPFDQFKEMQNTGKMGTITIGQPTEKKKEKN
jgi:uncharacterized protein YozE (UPF0346 family)